ncbi:MAG: carbamoyltransferase HypF [Spirochaetales bacterium]|nr:carbamoyltransferase HypF [Spirochaetales bacterium]
MGFRPTIYRCAVSLGLKGFVQNRRSEVVAEIQGSRNAVKKFYPHLKEMLPPSALIETYIEETISPVKESSFSIVESLSTAYNFPPIPPDLAICDDCKNELFDPKNRRFLYPFITCTQCGPRYSIVEDTPFDRETTSMIDFPQCTECLAEYTNPMDRRFHSQTNSCDACGPVLTLIHADGTKINGDPVINTIEALNRGAVVAIQGIGGFHLAVNILKRESIIKLRAVKNREKKPFALMVKNLETAEKLTVLEQPDKDILKSPESPILILPCRDNIPENYTLVSDTKTLGIFLPYTPLHLLLFEHPNTEIKYESLIMTSGNRKDEPIVIDPKIALEKLNGIAELFLYNNRRILFRTDDSIVRRGNSTGMVLVRRSRGFVPRLIHILHKSPETVIGAGGDLKNAPALLKGNDIYLSPYIGDLDNPEAQKEFKNQIKNILKLYNANPETVIYDMHPFYNSSHWARKSSFKNKIEVQHHHAHILSVMAENNLSETLGLSFDGTGFGTDGAIWGGEFLLAERSSFQRLGHFGYIPLPGGEAAIRHPVRILAAALHSLMSPDLLFKSLREISDLSENQFDIILEMLNKRINSPLTSSLGRIFDAAASALDLVNNVTYEGEGPVKLEGIALHYLYDSNPHDFPDEWQKLPVVKDNPDNSTFYIDISALLLKLLDERKKRRKDYLAWMFHNAIAQASIRGVEKMHKLTGIKNVSLSGGVFQNIILRELLVPQLKDKGYDVFLNRAVPPGDGGLSLGQVYFNYREE